ncbi:MAG: bifunctional anthranilate synthase component I family protein/class IV aminotransferase [Burkholderiales bacterium]|nr:bifunctional anthranilate synthase component I family protein/class IV aminotransferase [Burkholderiales bacterium]
MQAAFDFPKHPLAREDGERLRGAWYQAPRQLLTANRPADVAPLLDAAHAAALEGAWVLGGLRYEAAPALNAALPGLRTEGPLAQFAVYDEAPSPWPDATTTPTERCTAWRQCLRDPASDALAIEQVREFIRAGDCYQVNLTTRLASTLQVPLAELFLALHTAQPGGFSIYLEAAGVASVSPELFFDWRPLPGHTRTWLLAAQPMKGTAPRGVDRAADEAAQQHLRTSEKERAENLMIVDLLRNDLGRVASLGSVRVPRLFELHELPSVWQMTSTVTAVTPRARRLSEIFAALFPCGSVTGAPKRRAMQIIAELEAAPRGWYCGALGLIQPGGAATFNVPIRTVEATGERLRFGVGSGITLDAEPQPELAEWRAKTRFLERARAPVQALETLRLQDGVYPEQTAHLNRLMHGARHFGLSGSREQALDALQAIASQHAQGVWRVRLLLGERAEAQCEALASTPQPVRLQLAPRPIESRGALAEFIRFKTTRREAYTAFDKPAGIWDLILWNEDGELTEGCFGNLALQIDGQWLTPRLEAGLLPGVGRARWLRECRVREARLEVDDLQRATGLAWFNALRGWLDAEWTDPAPRAQTASASGRNG